MPAKIRKEVMIVGEVMEAGPEFSQGKGRKGRRARRRVGEVQERDTRWRQRAREHALRPPTPPPPQLGVFRASGRLLGKSEEPQSAPAPPSSARSHSGRLQGQRVADEKHGPSE